MAVHIVPNGKQNQIIGVMDDALKIRLRAPAVEGKANDALLRFMATSLDVSQSAICITQGHTNKWKLLEVRDAHLTLEKINGKLLSFFCQ
ncbi:MAG: DUF167 domain-containing protein [Pseudomonadota bacterium]